MIHTLIFLLFTYSGVLASLYIWQDKLIFFPSKEIIETPKDYNLPYKDLYFSLDSQTKIHAWLIENPKAKSVIILCHGNAGNIANRLHLIYHIYQMNFSILIFDYPGFGKSTGKVNEESSYQAAQKSWDYLVEEKKVKSNHIIIWGRSIGGAIAAHLAKNKQAEALILESSFTSLLSIAKKQFPVFPIKQIARYSYDTSKIIAEIKIPTLIIHSKEDEIIPFTHGEELYKKANEPKQFLEIKGSHNEGWFISRKKYFKEIKEFILKN